MDISVGLSSNSEIIDTLDKTKSSSDSDSSFTLSSSIAATKGSSVESKDESDKDIKTEMDNIFLND
jgi:hypothetical protein